MLPSLGLFKSIPCPYYPTCPRPNCFYSHEAVRSSTIQDRQKETVKRRKVAPTPAVPTNAIDSKKTIELANKVTPLIPAKKTEATATVAVRSTVVKAPASAISARAAMVASRAQQLQSSTTDSKKRTAHTPTFKVQPTGPPIILPNIKSSIPLKVRQLIANKLFDQYKRIYDPILANNPTLATDHTKQQEEKVLHSTKNEAGYKQMSMSLLMALKKRPLSTNDDDIGLVGEWIDPATQIAVQDKLYDQALECLVPLSTLKQLEYPLPELLKVEVLETPEMVGTIQKCDRCKQEYLIKDILSKEDLDICVYHPARLKTHIVDGQKERVFGCCEDPIGSVGCTRGPHVYKDNDLTILHQKTPFKKTPRVAKHRQKIVALDCEMGYTTAGMELIRLTVVDQDMKVLLDELVLPRNMMIDLNTHYSGVRTLEGVRHDLESVRELLFDWIDEDTIMVGHGLENDLNAMRVIHTKVVDTVALFPHKGGLPFRNSLRGLASGVLKKFIQTGTDGHDSFEDAHVCIELLRAYIKKNKG